MLLWFLEFSTIINYIRNKMKILNYFIYEINNLDFSSN